MGEKIISCKLEIIWGFIVGGFAYIFSYLEAHILYKGCVTCVFFVINLVQEIIYAFFLLNYYMRWETTLREYSLQLSSNRIVPLVIYDVLF